MVNATSDGWNKIDTIYYKTFGLPPVSNKIAAFDLDSTLVYTPSFFTTRASTPRPSGGLIISPNDYVIYSDKVYQYLQSYHDKGYAIVVFSNQKGPAEAGLVDMVKSRMDNIFSGFKIKSHNTQLPLHVLFSTKNDKYRKPKSGMYEFFRDCLNKGVEPDLTCSFYVGDAAGRDFDSNLSLAIAKNLKNALDKLNINFDRTIDDNIPKRFEDLHTLESLLNRDHSKCDLLFAKNIKFTFFTPEEFFGIYPC